MSQLPPTNEQVLMQVAQQFLTRADLKGGEVDNYAKCFNFIQTIVEGTNLVVPAAAFHEGLNAIKELAELKAEKVKDGLPVLKNADTPVLELVEDEDTSDGEDMISEGAPVGDLEVVE